jgi:hypothetical protein
MQVRQKRNPLSASIFLAIFSFTDSSSSSSSSGNEHSGIYMICPYICHNPQKTTIYIITQTTCSQYIKTESHFREGAHRICASSLGWRWMAITASPEYQVNICKYNKKMFRDENSPCSPHSPIRWKRYDGKKGKDG